MKFKIKNLGPIQQAEFQLGALTTISGMNNTGKTYITHAVFGFLDYFHQSYDIDLPAAFYTNLDSNAAGELDLAEIHDNRNKIVASASKDYSSRLDFVFAGPKARFSDAGLFVSDLSANESLRDAEYSRKIGTHSRPTFLIEKKRDSTKLEITLLDESANTRSVPREIVDHFISDAVKECVFKPILPTPFISSAERTGAAIFQKELDFTRIRLIEMLGEKSAKLNPFELMDPFRGRYPLAVRKNVDFIRAVGSLKDEVSFISTDHSNVLQRFNEIIGGEYIVDKDGDVQFVPTDGKVKLSLVESSSAVRSLVDIGFYLRHLAKKGDLLVVDEPELNLHPENQRKVARLFATLVQLGLKVFITTHSDYIIKELNTLMMLHPGHARLESIASEEGYSKHELLEHGKVRSYCIAEDKVVPDGKRIRKSMLTLIPAAISEDRGIELKSFDETIETMNRIQDAIVWGGNGTE